MIRFKSTHPGISLQDLGRTEGREHGFSRGGALDEISYLNGNKLLGNSSTAPAIEIILGGFEAEFSKATTMAITGDPMDLTLNGLEKIEANRPVKIQKGDYLISKGPSQGLISYLSLAGGFKAQTFLGSVSIPRREQGLFPAHSNQEFEYDEFFGPINGFKIDPLDLSPHRLEFFPSYQNEFFRYQKIKLIKTSRFDRMGAICEGNGISYEGKGFRSEGIALGSLQFIEPNQVVALFNDCQTIGGYPKLGVLTKKAKCQLAQMRPGCEVELLPFVDKADKSVHLS